jgi:DNA-directed RNA polymerase specialized sigma24 family protein
MARQKLSPMAEAGACRAHDEIYRLHKRDLGNSIKRFPGRLWSKEEVEDLIQKALWSAYQKAHQFNADARGVSDEESVHSLAHAWLTMIAYHTFINEGRAHKGEITILNVADLAKRSNETDPEDLLDIDRCKREGTARLIKEAERQHYPPTETEVEFGPEASEQIDMAAARMLSESDLDVFLTERTYYPNAEEKKQARRKLEIRRILSSNLRSKRFSRCFKKIIKHATKPAKKLLSARELGIFRAVTKLDSKCLSKENEWRELENTYHLTCAELREISEQCCKRIRDYLMAHADE